VCTPEILVMIQKSKIALRRLK